MENCAKVFSSNIIRAKNHHKNNLYDLLHIVPATPLKTNAVQKYTCNYCPKTDKYYTPKKKSRLKVKTVRDIRNSFEQETFTYLHTDLEKQQNVLFKKIRHGSSRNDNTKKMAINILKGDAPISRSTWQMLINLNPENRTYPKQFVLWNGKYIQVNGSLGGRNNLICNYDLACRKIPSQTHKKVSLKHNTVIKKKGLLRNSIAVKFKSGPLSKKQYLDDSHQKYHVGNIELIHLPKPGLDIKPTYGTALESTIINYLNKLRPEDGTISQKWAEMAVSVLGTMKNSKVVQLNKDSVPFDLVYKYNQNRILMRRDANNYLNTSESFDFGTIHANMETDCLSPLPEIKDIVNKMIDAVEISIMQDDLFSQEPEQKQFTSEDLNTDDTLVKDKAKKKFGELDRLDVTVIRLPETEGGYLTKICGKAYCSYGCICASLAGTFNMKQHCGRLECMFDCKCDFPKYQNGLSSTEYYDRMELLNIDSEINLNLAKEEQKFHQTVIVTGEKRILLKGERRNWKTSKKYADFYSNMSLKTKNVKTQDLSIVVSKLNCNNIEPWCMVHKLYKCFCKGRFTETCASVPKETDTKESLSKETLNNVESVQEKAIETSDGVRHDQKCYVKKSKISANIDIPNKIRRATIVDKSTNSTLESLSIDTGNEVQSHRTTSNDSDKTLEMSSLSERNKNNIEKGKMITRHSLRKFSKISALRNSNGDKNEKKKDSESSDSFDPFDEDVTSQCSRTNAYEGRKYSNGYYKNTNNKILEMEKNDKRLQERLAILNNTTHEVKPVTKPTEKAADDTKKLLELLCDVTEMYPPSINSDDVMHQGKRKRLSNETKLVSWLETNYKMYKKQNDEGLFKNALEPPKLGKVALYSWDFILKRYRERKNLFLVSKYQPYRIFMAVNTRNQFFDNCININVIRFADLYKYPQTVKNLLINATDLKDNFCILRGLTCCWELIGSVTKVNEDQENNVEREETPDINIESTDMDASVESNQNTTSTSNLLIGNMETNEVETHSIPVQEFESCAIEFSEDAGSSKWFVMTIENDFSEIRFFRKGFFVKYESIINAINVARLSGKTVRLSSKKCIEQCEAPQFGIYAIPNDNEYCVFVGPYELDDTLGIETIKTILDVRKLKRTRGFWITTNKVDNLRVVENPLSFVTLNNPQNNNELPLETHFSESDDVSKIEEENVPANFNENNIVVPNIRSPPKKEIKIVKPIKIRKTNGFYHLASDGILKKISLQKTAMIGMDANNTILKPNTISNSVILESSQEPVNEEMPSIKIASVFSTKNDDSLVKSTRPEKGMFILKPEEINRKLFESKLMSEELPMLISTDDIMNGGNPNTITIETRIESFPSTSEEWNAPRDNIFIISDDDDENDTICETTTSNIWRDVWIECTNVSNLGWIAGIKNVENLLSFKFPGCEYSEFSTEEEAFNKINSELFKRIDGSMNLKLEWKVTESADQLQGQEMNPEHLYPDYILTEGGLLHTSYTIIRNKDINLKTYSKTQLKDKGHEIPLCEIVKVDSLSQSHETNLLCDDTEEKSRIEEDLH